MSCQRGYNYTSESDVLCFVASRWGVTDEKKGSQQYHFLSDICIVVHVMSCSSYCSSFHEIWRCISFMYSCAFFVEQEEIVHVKDLFSDLNIYSKLRFHFLGLKAVCLFCLCFHTDVFCWFSSPCMLSYVDLHNTARLYSECYPTTASLWVYSGRLLQERHMWNVSNCYVGNWTRPNPGGNCCRERATAEPLRISISCYFQDTKILPERRHK